MKMLTVSSSLRFDLHDLLRGGDEHDDSVKDEWLSGIRMCTSDAAKAGHPDFHSHILIGAKG